MPHLISRSTRAGRRWPLLLAALAGLGATTLVAGQPAASGAESDGTRTVSYQGYQVEVPDDWRVVDLAEDPTACVRFDRPTVYLGEPAAQQDCPANVVGRTAAVLIEPLEEVAADRVSERTATSLADAESHDGAIELAVEEAGVLVTAAHGPAQEATVREVLGSARVTDAAEPAALPEAPAEQPEPLLAGPQPGDYLGLGFDACTAPSQGSMDAWLANSPYQAIGVYISGAQRGCSQGNLTASWVESQTSKGWHLFPIDVGRQAPCSNYSQRISTDPATAHQQGVDAAAGAVSAAQSLGIPAGSAVYSDIEAYSRGGSCTTGVLNYLSGWTEGLHAAGYLSGMYSSGASGVADVAAAYNDTSYTRVDHLFFAWWNGRADTDSGQYAPNEYWADHQRIHQYVGEVTETYGGVSINIDRDYLDVGEGTVPAPSCAGVNTNFTAYPDLVSGDGGAEVSAAQCQLLAAGFDPGEGTPTGEYDAGTVAAVEAFQGDRGLTVTGDLDAGTWTALLSLGSTPQLQNGSTGEAVTRLQRALTAALGRTVGIDGQFGPETEQAVIDYQGSRSLDADGIVGPLTWGALQSGR
ncbi:glycoside hydrolase domain-containing protein [Streptomyces sp. B6B3]|uniref:glycoside hydrolase domain-containing protein n=1 Tax=Streptomyces sp. B6B3 TaxID=3153570 RepID=UPI00325E55E5